jgi:hypothetical protein
MSNGLGNAINGAVAQTAVLTPAQSLMISHDSAKIILPVSFSVNEMYVVEHQCGSFSSSVVSAAHEDFC